MDNKINMLQKIDKELKEEILDQLPAFILAINKDFDVIYANRFITTQGEIAPENIIGHKCYEVLHSNCCKTKECWMQRALDSGRPVQSRGDVVLNGHQMPTMHYASPLKDSEGNVRGVLEIAVDITEQLQYENKLKEQSNTIRQLATPTIQLWDGVLVLPVVGVIDSMRAQYMMESVLNKIQQTYAKVIIIDIQGVAAMDSAVANHLIKITKATKLMGCECILSGISPAVAQTIIHLGVEMSAINTKANLKDALSTALSLLGIEVKKSDSEADSGT
jgi:rsbT co-antagonist protein RsbR